MINEIYFFKGILAFWLAENSKIEDFTS